MSLPVESKGQNAELRFFDKKGNLIKLSAQESNLKGKFFFLKKIKLSFLDSICIADTGKFNISTSKGNVSTNVKFTNSKFVLITDNLELNLNEKKIKNQSKTSVNFNGNLNVSSDGIYYDIKKSKMHFIGNVKLKIMDLQNNHKML